jgi:outer membrane protein assembly factor BamD
MKRRIFLVISLIIFFCLIQGCNRAKVNLNELAPEQQFDYAKSYFDRKNYHNAKFAFTHIIMNNPGHPIIEKTMFFLAETHFMSREYILAIEEYERLIRQLPRSEFADHARFKIGLAYYNLSPNYQLDQEYTKRTISELQRFLDEYPQSPYRERAVEKIRLCRNKLGRKEYKTGELYRKMGIYPSAIISFNAVIDTYYDTPFIGPAFYWKAECHRIMGIWRMLRQHIFHTLTIIQTEIILTEPEEGWRI